MPELKVFYYFSNKIKQIKKFKALLWSFQLRLKKVKTKVWLYNTSLKLVSKFPSLPAIDLLDSYKTLLDIFTKVNLLFAGLMRMTSLGLLNKIYDFQKIGIC